MATENQETTADLAKRALLGVAGFALAISLVHLGQGIGLILALGMPPLTGFALQGFAMDLLLASGLGLALIWVYKLPRGEWILPGLLTVVYIGLERVVAVDPSKLQMWVVPSIAALIVFSIGRAIWARKPAAVLGIAAGLLALMVVAPLVADAMRPKDVREVKAAPAPAGAPDVLMIVMDTVRSQSCGTFGYARDTTPTLDALAKEGLVFEDAYAPATWSLPAHAALFTGTFPSRNAAHGETRYLGTTLPTLADWMAGKGWETLAFSANPHISPSFGLTRGFQHNDKAWAAGTSGRNFSFIYRMVDALGIGGVDDKGGAVVVGNIEEWMGHRPADDGPAFVFVNFLEAHFPFRQLPKEYRNAFQSADSNTLREIDQIAFGVQFGRQLTPDEMDFVHQPLVDLYDGGVKYTDHLVGEVIDIWRKAGRLDNTVVVILADHGEVVGEHGAFGHVTPMLEQDLRVPLVVRYPPRIEGGQRVSTPVSTVGTAATIFDLAGVPEFSGIQVHSLMQVASGEDLRAGEPILAERFEEEMLASRFAEGAANGTGEQVCPRGRYRVFRSGPWKYVQHEDGADSRSHLFNLETDPGEDRDVIAHEEVARTVIERELQDALDSLELPAIDAEVTAPVMSVADMSDEERQSLCALGYLTGPACD